MPKLCIVPRLLGNAIAQICKLYACQAQTEESISTCRFAQRVSTIKNDARVNEDVDPGVLIRRLRSDCANLSDELAFLKVWRGRCVSRGKLLLCS